MNKKTINRFLRRFGVELHGLGYLEKIQKNSFRNNPFQVQGRFVPVNKPVVIFDAGANNGSTTEKYRGLYPASTVHAFEPIPDMAALFEQRHAGNDRVILNRLALSDKAGEVSFNINKSPDTSSLLESASIGSSSDPLCQTVSTITVRTATIDDYCRDMNISRIDILKMDTQGSELNILRGASRMLAEQRVGLIFTEVYFKQQYQQQPLFDELFSFLRKMDFDLQDIYETQYNQRQLLWGDAIFIHKSLGQ